MADAAALARESPYTVADWQHALNLLGSRADELILAVKDCAARLGAAPYAAASQVLALMPPGRVPDHLNPLLRCHGCGAYCSLPSSILAGQCCECRGELHARW